MKAKAIDDELKAVRAAEKRRREKEEPLWRNVSDSDLFCFIFTV